LVLSKNPLISDLKLEYTIIRPRIYMHKGTFNSYSSIATRAWASFTILALKY